MTRDARAEFERHKRLAQEARDRQRGGMTPGWWIIPSLIFGLLFWIGLAFVVI